MNSLNVATSLITNDIILNVDRITGNNFIFVCILKQLLNLSKFFFYLSNR